MSFRKLLFTTLAISLLTPVGQAAAYNSWNVNSNFLYPTSWDTNAPNGPQLDNFKARSDQSVTYRLRFTSYQDHRFTTMSEATDFYGSESGQKQAWATGLASYANAPVKTGQGVYPGYAGTMTLNVNLQAGPVKQYKAYHDQPPYSLTPGWWFGNDFSFAELKERPAKWVGSMVHSYTNQGGGTTTVETPIDTDAFTTPIHLGREQRGEVMAVH